MAAMLTHVLIKHNAAPPAYRDCAIKIRWQMRAPACFLHYVAPAGSRRLTHQVPHSQRQRERAQTISHQGRLAAMNLKSFPEGKGGGDEHHDASNLVHARILSAASMFDAMDASILNRVGRRFTLLARDRPLPSGPIMRVDARPLERNPHV